MWEEEVLAAGGVVKIKGVTAWSCTECGRVEYRGTGVTGSATYDKVKLSTEPCLAEQNRIGDGLPHLFSS